MKIGVSECLLGVQCRYDGLSSTNKFITNTLQEYFEFQAYCHEKLIFGTPREAIRLVEQDQGVKVVTPIPKKK